MSAVRSPGAAVARFAVATAFAGLLVALGGCAGLSDPAAAGAGSAPGARADTSVRPPPPPPAPAPGPGHLRLEQGVALFEAGRFAEAIRLLQEAPEILADTPQVRARALKVLAFSQCVSARRGACRRSFDALLVLDPGFELDALEAGHPAWGPEFERARAAARAGAQGGPGAKRAAR